MMTRSQLNNLKKEELLEEAKKIGLKAVATLRKDQLVERIVEALEKGRAAGNKKETAMESKESKKSLLKKVIGAPAQTPPAKSTNTYARKPASNIQRRKTTLRKLPKTVAEKKG